MTYEEFLLMLQTRKKIRSGSITGLKLAENSITIEKITDPAINEIKLITQRTVIEEKKDDYSVLKSDFGKLLLMNATTAKMFRLPEVIIEDIGLPLAIMKRGTGALTIKAGGTDTIQDSTAGGTLYNDLTEETFALINLRIIAVAKWMIEYFSGSGWRTS